MRTLQFFYLLSILSAATAAAQNMPQVPLQSEAERQAIDSQGVGIFAAIQPVVKEAAPSTVWVWAGKRRVAMGTVIGDGTEVLTKWSQIAFLQDAVQVVDGVGKTGTARVSGVYEADDIALLKVTGATFTPIQWANSDDLPLGRFLVAAGPTGQALQVGVVAVAERSLRDSDQAFLGIQIDPSYTGKGVRIGGVTEGSGAAGAKLRKGDILTGINGVALGSSFELRGKLAQLKPGDSINLSYLRGKREESADVLLAGRPEYQQIPESRLRTMRRMGGPISLVGRGFPVAVQTDMRLLPEQAGGPVVDLKGEAVGMTIARTDRTRSFIVPSSRIISLLEQKPTEPSLASLPQQPGGHAYHQGIPMGHENGATPNTQPMSPGSADLLRQHLEEMSGLLERMKMEMQGLGR